MTDIDEERRKESAARNRAIGEAIGNLKMAVKEKMSADAKRFVDRALTILLESP